MSKKSKQQSNILPLLELLDAQTPLFLDRDQGSKRMPTLLKEARINIRWHAGEGFPSVETDDTEWIQAAASRGYIIITSDKSVETDPINRQAVIESKAKVFILDENNSKAIHWAAAIIVSKEKIYELARDNEGPFFASVLRKTYGMVYRFRVPQLVPENPSDPVRAA
jgi:predicted nuclease of predicted toxin-antitoxin system